MKLYEKCITWYNQGIVVERKFCGYEFFEEEHDCVVNRNHYWYCHYLGYW